MNQGERDELIIQLKLIDLKQKSFNLNQMGIINSVKFKNEYKDLPAGLDLDRIQYYSDEDLQKLANSCEIKKASGRSKADTIINGERISLKSNKGAPPALVNHTTRPGFEFAAVNSCANILHLDEIIQEYWILRNNGRIAEDIPNTSLLSPFRNRKEQLRPFLNYFLFDGTGSGLSILPADRILAFTNPLDETTWTFYNKIDAVDLYWDKLIFSVRAKKGMPNGYPNNMSAKALILKPSIDIWTKSINGDYRGALHIRSR